VWPSAATSTWYPSILEVVAQSERQVGVVLDDQDAAHASALEPVGAGLAAA
jgi:hypothetical protein